MLLWAVFLIGPADISEILRMHSSIYFLAFLSSALADTVITRYTTDENGVITFEVSTLKMTFKIIFAKLYWLRITHNITAIKIYSSKIISLRCLHRYSLKTQHPFFQKLNKQVCFPNVKEPIASNKCWQFTWVGPLDNSSQTQDTTCR